MTWLRTDRFLNLSTSALNNMHTSIMIYFMNIKKQRQLFTRSDRESDVYLIITRYVNRNEYYWLFNSKIIIKLNNAYIKKILQKFHRLMLNEKLSLWKGFFFRLAYVILIQWSMRKRSIVCNVHLRIESYDLVSYQTE